MPPIQSFSKETVERLARTVRDVLGEDKRRRPERRRKNTIVKPAFNIRIAVLDGDLAHGGSATASVYTANAGTESDSGENVTVYDFGLIGSGKEIVTGAKITIGNVNGYWYLISSGTCPTTA